MRPTISRDTMLESVWNILMLCNVKCSIQYGAQSKQHYFTVKSQHVVRLPVQSFAMASIVNNIPHD